MPLLHVRVPARRFRAHDRLLDPLFAGLVGARVHARVDRSGVRCHGCFTRGAGLGVSRGIVRSQTLRGGVLFRELVARGLTASGTAAVSGVVLGPGERGKRGDVRSFGCRAFFMVASAASIHLVLRAISIGNEVEGTVGRTCPGDWLDELPGAESCSNTPDRSSRHSGGTNINAPYQGIADGGTIDDSVQYCHARGLPGFNCTTSKHPPLYTVHSYLPVGDPLDVNHGCPVILAPVGAPKRGNPSNLCGIMLRSCCESTIDVYSLLSRRCLTPRFRPAALSAPPAASARTPSLLESHTPCFSCRAPRELRAGRFPLHTGRDARRRQQFERQACARSEWFLGAKVDCMDRLDCGQLPDTEPILREFCIEKIEDTDSKFWRAILIGSTLGMYLGSIAMTIVMYIFFAGSGCSMNQAAITVNLILLMAISVLSIHPSIQASNPRAGLAQAAIVSIYCTYLTFSAVAMEPDDQQCNPLVRATGTRTASTVIGAIVTFVMCAYTTTRAATYGLAMGAGKPAGYGPIALEEEDGAHSLVSTQPASRRELRAEALRRAVESGALPASALDDDSDDEDDSPAGKTAGDDEKNGTQYNYALFHIIFMLATAWVATLLTQNVGGDHNKQESDFIAVGRTYWASWVKIVSAWVCYCIFGWTLGAPVLMPDRFDFSG
nr:membrane protein tms1 [Quercus suber]